MDNERILERIDAGNLRFEETIDGFKVQVELEAADSLGLLLRRISVDSGKAPAPTLLQKQTEAIVERLAWLDDLKVIEVDGMSQAVQVRSRKPGEDGFNEVILRKGNFASFERHGAGALHMARKQFVRLAGVLTEVF